MVNRDRTRVKTVAEAKKGMRNGVMVTGWRSAFIRDAIFNTKFAIF